MAATAEVIKMRQTDNLPAMTKAEQKRLIELEEIIRENIIGAYKFWCALREINIKRLYRQTHETFEEYCNDVWDISPRTGYQYISAADVVDNVRNCAQIEFYPQNEAQARPLTRLSKDAQLIAWQKVIETAPEGKITAAHVAKVVKGIVDGFSESKKKEVTERIDRAEQFSKPFRQGFQTFLDVVWEARGNGWKETSKKAVLKHIDEVRKIVVES